MSEHSHCDPLFFKGQMAARYKERMSMGFALANSKKGDSESSILVSSNHSSPTTGVGAEAKHAATRTADHSRKASEPRGRSARTIGTGRLCPSRSKSSLDEHQACSNKPTMKELITKFETRSFTSGQFKQNATPDVDKQQIASDAWGTSCSPMLLEVDPAAIFCSSLSDVGDSKSSSSLPKHPRAQTSKAALSLNSETNLGKQERFINVSRPPSDMTTRTTPEKFFKNDLNTHRRFDRPSFYNKPASEGEAGDMEFTSRTKRTASNVDQGITEVPSKTDNQEDSSAPTRVNIRSVATRRKINAGSKYVVHKKDWAKQLPIWQKDIGSIIMGVSTNANSSQAFQSSQNAGLPKEDATVNTLNAPGDIPGRANDRSDSPGAPSTQPRLNTRSASRHSERPDHGKEKVTDDKQRPKSMERYLQFLRASNQSQQNNATTDAKTLEKSEQRKAQRPPTPHRLLHLRKGNNIVPKNSLHLLRESIQSACMQDDAGLKARVERDTKPYQLSRRGQRWKLSSAADKKDQIIDSSGGDFYVNAPVSSSNSIDSSLYEFQNNQSPGSRIGEPKSETADIRFARSIVTPKQMSKYACISGRNSVSRSGQKGPQSRAHSARGHELNEKKLNKQQLTALMRGRSSSASKTPDSINVEKVNHLQGISPKSITPASPKILENTRHPTPSNNFTENGKKSRSLKYGISDIGSLILTEDELADNDLVPVHLREKRRRDSPGHICVALSSSNESCSHRSVTSKLGMPQFKSSSQVSNEKRASAVIDKMDPFYFNKHDNLQTPKHPQLNQDTKQAKTIPRPFLDRKRPYEYSKFFSVQTKARPTATPIKSSSREPSFDDSSNHKNAQIMYTKGSNVPLGSQTKLNRTTENHPSLSKKEGQTTKDSLILSVNVTSDIHRGSNHSREGRERKIHEDVLNFSELQSSSRKMDILQAAGEGSSELGLPHLQQRFQDHQRESPTRKTYRQFLNGQNPNAPRDNSKEGAPFNDDVDASREVQYMHDNAFNYFHFGQNEGKNEETSELDTKTDKGPTSSPQKKKRKADQPKKVAKKKKKIDDMEEESFWSTSHSVATPRVTPDRKSVKEKMRDCSKDKEMGDGKPDTGSKSDKFENPVRRKSSTDMCFKSHHACSKHNSEQTSAKHSGKHKKDTSMTWSSKKVASPENSPASVISNSRGSPRKDVCTTSDKSPAGRKPYSNISGGLELRPLPRLAYDIGYKLRMRSLIPKLLSPRSFAPRRKMDRLIQYRRWREAMMDCLRPSKLPLSESFRKTLDSAVMEEWAMHCWQPSKDMYVDSQGVWWSASYQEIGSPGGVHESLLGDGRVLSKEWLLDTAVRLPYMKIGPVRLLHASYVLVAMACLTLGHIGVQLYNCGGDDYEYFCPDDDLECLMEMFSHNTR